MSYRLPGVLLLDGEVPVTVEVNDERSVTLEVSSDGVTVAVEFSAEEFEILNSFVASQQDRIVYGDYQEPPEAEEPDSDDDDDIDLESYSPTPKAYKDQF
jgi:hypothetical protein